MIKGRLSMSAVNAHVSCFSGRVTFNDSYTKKENKHKNLFEASLKVKTKQDGEN